MVLLLSPISKTSLLSCSFRLHPHSINDSVCLDLTFVLLHFFFSVLEAITKMANFPSAFYFSTAFSKNLVASAALDLHEKKVVSCRKVVHDYLSSLLSLTASLIAS